jgi:hypothetical protein
MFPLDVMMYLLENVFCVLLFLGLMFPPTDMMTVLENVLIALLFLFIVVVAFVLNLVVKTFIKVICTILDED